MIEPQTDLRVTFDGQIESNNDIGTQKLSAVIQDPLLPDAILPRLMKKRVLAGANAHFHSSVISQLVNLGDFAGSSTASAGAQFAWRFMDRFLDSRMRTPLSAPSPGFVDRLNSEHGVAYEEALLEAILAVETEMRFAMKELEPIAYAQWIADGSGAGTCVWATNSPKLSRRVASVALAGLLELLSGGYSTAAVRGKGYAMRLARLKLLASRYQRSTTIAVLELAARQRGIPVEILSGASLRLGQGYRQRILMSTITPETSFLAMKLSRNKKRTCVRLAELGLPVPLQHSVKNVSDAVRAAESLGYPVVVKPIKKKQSNGVSVNVNSPDALSAAFKRASKFGRVLVECSIPGHVYRIVVIKSDLALALKMALPEITGDGKSSIAELIRELNSDPLRDGLRLKKVPIDRELRRTIRSAGHSMEAILEDGQVLVLSSTANFSRGIIPVDVSASVHPDNREIAVRAAQAIGIDIAGVDFISADISRSYKETGGKIIGVNARPGLSMAVSRQGSSTRDVASRIIEHFYPDGEVATIPVIIIAGEKGTNAVTRTLSSMLGASGRCVGVLDRNGKASINGEWIQQEDSDRSEALRSLLLDPRVETVLASTTLRNTDKRGMGIEAIEVCGVIEARMEPDEAYRRGVALLAQRTQAQLIVNASNKQALEALTQMSRNRLVLVGLSEDEVKSHVADGGRAVFGISDEAGDRIIFLERGRSPESILIPGAITAAGPVKNMRQLAFTAAMAKQIGLTCEIIERLMAIKQR